MVFNFITDIDSFNIKEIISLCYNLFLAYFYFDICKWLLAEFRVLRSILKRVGGVSNVR